MKFTISYVHDKANRCLRIEYTAHGRFDGLKTTASVADRDMLDCSQKDYFELIERTREYLYQQLRAIAEEHLAETV